MLELKNEQKNREREKTGWYIYALTQNENNYYNINYTGFGINTNKAEEEKKLWFLFFPERQNTSLHI
jgi:hypothetical protein